MTDWMAIMAELKKHMTYKEIAEKTGTTRAGLNFLACGKVVAPTHATGEILLALHKKLTGQEPDAPDALTRRAQAQALLRVKAWIDDELKRL